jgi:proprotein convertase subtilisin/kexin type 5
VCISICNQLTLECNFRCSLCKAAVNCTSCAANSNRNATMPSCPCVLKFFERELQPNCDACYANCLTCKDEKNTNCLSCVDRRKLDGGPMGKCICIVGYFSEPDDVNCSACSYTCETCNGAEATNCLTCQPNSYRTYENKTKECPCNLRYYDDSKSTTCLSITLLNSRLPLFMPHLPWKLTIGLHFL